jgi:hypothetical protein
MELVGIENSRIIFLTQIHRPSGQLYFPDAAAKLVERYSFVKVPNLDQPLPYVFSIGKFQDAQITELTIYGDGLIVSSASDTDLLDAFIEDLLSWATKDLGLVQMTAAKSEKFYESSIVVKSISDLPKALGPQNDVTATLKAAMKSAQIKSSFELSGFILDLDPGDFVRKRKPFRFVVDRRVGVPFVDNVFYSRAPFRTQDHLLVLRLLEGMVPKPRRSRSR